MGMTDLSTQDLTARVKAEAKRIGFELVGVTGPAPPSHLDVYHQWLAEGRHGGMNYLADERALKRRSDPLQILPECQSILTVAVNYFPGDHQHVENTPRVAAYAQGDDYHDVLIERLEQLARFIETRVGGSVPHRKYTDTGPLLEREFAQRSGLGWIGKNTCLINPSHGSYLFLAELLLGVQLEPDTPFEEDHCGTCTRCVDACPTSCILPDRTIDARLCISYLTIEHKDFVPHELREKIGDWLFGCDICQQVCPWNRFSLPTKDPAFQTRSFHPLSSSTPESRRSCGPGHLQHRPALERNHRRIPKGGGRDQQLTATLVQPEFVVDRVPRVIQRIAGIQNVAVDDEEPVSGKESIERIGRGAGAVNGRDG